MLSATQAATGPLVRIKIHRWESSTFIRNLFARFVSSGYGHRLISGSLNFIKTIFRIFLVRPFSSMKICYWTDKWNSEMFLEQVRLKNRILKQRKKPTKKKSSSETYATCREEETVIKFVKTNFQGPMSCFIAMITSVLLYLIYRNWLKKKIEKSLGKGISCSPHHSRLRRA